MVSVLIQKLIFESHTTRVVVNNRHQKNIWTLCSTHTHHFKFNSLNFDIIGRAMRSLKRKEKNIHFNLLQNLLHLSSNSKIWIDYLCNSQLLQDETIPQIGGLLCLVELEVPPYFMSRIHLHLTFTVRMLWIVTSCFFLVGYLQVLYYRLELLHARHLSYHNLKFYLPQGSF